MFINLAIHSPPHRYPILLIINFCFTALIFHQSAFFKNSSCPSRTWCVHYSLVFVFQNDTALSFLYFCTSLPKHTHIYIVDYNQNGKRTLRSMHGYFMQIIFLFCDRKEKNRSIRMLFFNTLLSRRHGTLFAGQR